VAVTASLAESLGWAVEDLIGRRVVVLVPPELREAHIAGFTRHLTTARRTSWASR
jgi:PAS domain S-box-containing protein